MMYFSLRGLFSSLQTVQALINTAACTISSGSLLFAEAPFYTGSIKRKG